MAKAHNQFTWTPAQVAAHCAKTGQPNPLESGALAKPALTIRAALGPDMRRGKMNKTEADFARILEAYKQKGEIADYVFEGITLRWGQDTETGRTMAYTPDFVETMKSGEIRMIEVKGAHVWSRDLVRFKGCRACWPQFKFEMWQKAQGSWKRIH